MVSFEARPFLPYDVPLVRRLMQSGASLDSEMALTNGLPTTLSSAVLSAFALTDVGAPTFVARSGDADFAAQFRHRTGDQHAHIAFIAPDLSYPDAENGWMALIDLMVYAAGKRGAYSLNAEADETSEAFTVLRKCGFAIYARQDIWYRAPAPLPDADSELLRPSSEADSFALNALYQNIVPRLVLQADTPPEPTRGLICEAGGKIVAFVSISEGRSGIYLQSFLHPELDHQAGAIHAAVLARLPRAERLPVYVCVRRYQDWLRGPLTNLGFASYGSQAVMVKHTVARIEHPALSAAPALHGAIRIVPPIKMVG